MTVVLFCGGQGLRLRERAHDVPKPLVPIGSEPALYHLMRYYAHHGHRHFVLCLGHRAEALVEHFVNARGRVAAEPRDDGSVRVILHADDGGPWTVDLVPTAPAASIGERLRAVRCFVEGTVFLCNYADGLSDLDLPAFLAGFAASGAMAGLISVPAPWGFHLVSVEAGGRVSRVSSAEQSGLRINGGFFAMRREVFDHLGPGEDLARDLFPRLIAAGRLFGYRHDGFWACMDTPQDWRALSEIDAGGAAPWKIWLPPAGARPTPTAAAEAKALR
jgi:glucose-1-phosphate cytidylyltransferase